MLVVLVAGVLEAGLLVVLGAGLLVVLGVAEKASE